MSPRLTADARGVHVIAATPFAADGALDLAGLDRLTDFYLARGADGLTLLGVMGEAPKLTGAEAQALVRRVIARAGRDTAVTVGVSAPGFAAMAELAAAAMDAGASGVMLAPAPHLRTDDQIVAWYSDAAAALGDTPLILQDFPLVTGVQIAVPVLARLAAALPSLVCLKHEDWPGLDKISALRAEGAMPRRLAILCGNGGCFLPEEMARGADGAMTGFAYPEMMRAVVDLAGRGELERARDLFDAWLPLVRMEMQPGLGLAVRKHILWRRGALAAPALRRPGAGLTPRAAAEIDALMARLARRLGELGVTLEDAA